MAIYKIGEKMPRKAAVESSRSRDKFIIRLPDGMRDRIEEVAKTTNRTMTSVIVTLLEASLQNWEPNKKPMKADDYEKMAMAAIDEVIEKAKSARSSLAAKKLLEM